MFSIYAHFIPVWLQKVLRWMNKKELPLKKRLAIFIGVPLGLALLTLIVCWFATARGYCGPLNSLEGAKYRKTVQYDVRGDLLTVEGAGISAADFTSRPPWTMHNFRIRRAAVVRADICEYMFTGMEKLREVRCDGVSGIYPHGFEDTVYLERVVCPGVIYLGDFAFSGCTSLRELSPLSEVRMLGRGVFSGCSALEEVYISASVRTLESYTFSGCSSLQYVDGLGGVTKIEEGAFIGCSALRELPLPQNLSSIGSRAFHGCTGITVMTVPQSVNRIANDAFDDWTAEQTIILECDRSAVDGELITEANVIWR